MVVVAKKYVVLRPFEGVPKESDFKIEEETLRDIEDGGKYTPTYHKT